MTALDSRLALALMAKAERVFGQPGQVLAFPLAGASYRADQLNFLPTDVDAETLRKALSALSDFSGLVNALPAGRAWPSAAGRADLPQVYRQVIEQAQVANPAESEADRQQLQAARRLLTIRSLDNTEVDTALYTAYKRYRDIWLLASQQYGAAKASGELGGDATARQAWVVNEPILKASLDKAHDDFLVMGHKNDVEAALARIDALTQQAPITQWHDWDLRSRRGTGTMADLTGQQFWPTYLSPANACEVGWQRMVLTRGEVDALQASAPEEMKAKLGAGGSALQVEQLEFEFTSAKLQRPWFDGGLLTSRFWRSRPGVDLQLSEGHEPFSGACPLYASAVVFFRRIRAVVQGETTAATSVGDQAGALDLGLIKPMWAAHRDMPSPPAGGGRLTGAQISSGMDGAVLTQAMEQGPEGRMPSGALMRPGLNLHRLQAPDEAMRPDPEGIAGLGKVQPRWRFAERDLVTRNLILRDEDWSPPPIQAPAPPAAGTSVLATNDDDIFILAFICNAVPASPNPDPGLAWNPAQ